MNILEKISIQIRHSALLKNATPLWSVLRPLYNAIVGLFGRKGLVRNINGTDKILVLPELRHVTESYEPDVWACVMSHIREDDVVVDVGAFVGLYALAIANRLNDQGKVVAFEPASNNRELFNKNIALNKLQNKIEVAPYAAGTSEGQLSFEKGRGSQSHVISSDNQGTSTVDVDTVNVTTLDIYFDGKSMDVMKIDVEGFEEQVLRGGEKILMDPQRSPRIMFIEVHPYAWKELGVTSDSFLTLLDSYDYDVTHIDGRPLEKINFYGEIIAKKRGT